MESLRETTYRNHIKVLHVAQLKAKECGVAVATKDSNKRAVYIQCVHGQKYKDTMESTMKHANTSVYSRTRAGMPLDIADECHFQVDRSIPRENFTHTVDVVPDGYCGFRVLAHLMLDDENEFPKVKAAMLNELNDNMDVYWNHFHYPVEELRKSLLWDIITKRPNMDTFRVLKNIGLTQHTVYSGPETHFACQ